MKKITKVDNIENTVRKGEKMKEKVIFILIISFVLQYVCFFTQTFAINQTISQDIETIESKTYPPTKEMIPKLKNEHQNWNFKILYTDLDWNEVIENEFTIPYSNVKNPSFSRFKEAFRLVKNKEQKSIKEAFDLGMELLFNYNLHPAIISACKNIDELDIYLDYLENNETDKFNCFNIKFEIAPSKFISKKYKRKIFFLPFLFAL